MRLEAPRKHGSTSFGPYGDASPAFIRQATEQTLDPALLPWSPLLTMTLIW